jgi:thioredoxin-like negative regulator of GroEL
VLIDDGSLRAKFRVKRTPTTVLLDRDGRAVRMFVGAQSRDSIERALDDVN